MKIVTILAGCVLLLVGLLSMLTPIPGGTAMIAIGLTLLICASETAARFIKVCREKFNFLNKSMTWVENHVPEKLSAGLSRTRPEIAEEGQ